MKRHVFAAFAGNALVFAAAISSLATPADYAFEPLAAAVKSGKQSDLAVRIIHKPTGKPVTGAVVFRTRLDMSPDNMGDMLTKVEAVPSSEAGVYHFKADLSMAGRWALKLMAKVPGESETVEGSVVFTAKD